AESRGNRQEILEIPRASGAIFARRQFRRHSRGGPATDSGLIWCSDRYVRVLSNAAHYSFAQPRQRGRFSLHCQDHLEEQKVMGAFKEAHGGELKDLYLPVAERQEEKRRARDLRSWDLTMRQLCDIELLLNGAFSPLEGFMTQADYDGVVERMRLANGVLWPMPITLDVTEEFAAELQPGETIALRDQEGVLIATLEVSDIYRPDKAREAEGVFRTTDEKHPGVRYLMRQANPVYVGGKLRGVEAPMHYDFKHL